MEPERKQLEHRIFAMEFVTSAAYAALLHRIRDVYEPNGTWMTVVAGTILSCAPAQLLARLVPDPTWKEYERWIIRGFVTSGIPIITWQLWLVAWRIGQAHGYERRPSYAHPTPPVEPQA